MAKFAKLPIGKISEFCWHLLAIWQLTKTANSEWAGSVRRAQSARRRRQRRRRRRRSDARLSPPTRSRRATRRPRESLELGDLINRSDRLVDGMI